MKSTFKVVGIFFAVTIFLFAFLCIFILATFKTEYKEIVMAEAEKSDIDPALVFAVIKAESKFDKNAKSKAGAIGLMQIKLDTANYMLELSGEQNIDEKKLFEPETNIKIGTKYLAYLINKFKNVNTAICAYNAGETVVRNWLSDERYSSDGKCLDSIPFKETRDYLNKIIFNQKIYKKMLNN